MKKSIFWGTILVSAVVTYPAWAQQRQSFTIPSEGSKGEYLQQHVIDFDDVPGHQARIYELRRTYPADNLPAIDGEISWTQ